MDKSLIVALKDGIGIIMNEKCGSYFHPEPDKGKLIDTLCMY